ncbi:MAG: DNA mismatch endonuclease Vsr [Proteobacteria bacterium]|nr:DNA mismatch endonuclease Vsr [Pseudomonadota bacterium]
MTDVLTRKQRSFNMGRIRSADTKPEIEVRSRLFRAGFRFRKNVANLPGKPDIVLPKYATVIFVHGCFWHGHAGCPKFRLPKSNRKFWSTKIKKNIERDEKVLDLLKAEGWRCIVIWQCELPRGSDKFYDRLFRLIRQGKK